MISNSIFSKSRFLMILALPAFLAGCFGDGDGANSVAGTPKLLTGQLWDAPLIGVQYYTESDPTIRKTNSAAQFEYRQFEQVTFFIGDIMLGTVTGAPIITPVDLTGSAQAVDQAAVNMMQFLQSIDSNEYPLDEITVTDAMITNTAGLSLDFNSATFATDLAAIVGAVSPGNAIVDDVTAITNFYQYGYQQFGGSPAVPWPFGDNYDDGSVGGIDFAPFPDFDSPVVLNTNSSFESDTNALRNSFNLTAPLPEAWVNGDSFGCGGNDVFDSGVFAGGGTIPPNSLTAPAAVTGSNVLVLQNNFDGFACNEIDVTGDIPYTAQVMVQSESDHLLTLQLAFFDALGDEVLSAQQLASTNQTKEGLEGRVYVAPNTWTPLSVTLTSPAEAVTARIQLGTIAFNDLTNTPDNFNDSGPTYFDDAEIVGPDTTAPDVPLEVGELITNGSFEEPDASGGDAGLCPGTVPATDWGCDGPPDTNFTTTAVTVQDGTQALKQFGQFGIALFDAPAIAGESYDGSVFVRSDTTVAADTLENQVRVELYFLNGAGIALDAAGNAAADTPIETVQIEPLGDFGNPPSTDVILVDDVWTSITIPTTVAPPNAVTVRMRLVHTNIPLRGITNGTGAGGAVFWDNASLTGPIDNSVQIFAEEFNSGSLDMSTWNIETGYGPNPLSPGWGNDEWQNYVPEAISFVDTGSENVLRITADCAAPCTPGKRDGTITSARITTQEKFSFATGRVEARIRVPTELSSWPAFWMLGSKITVPGSGWPKAGEIDILEVFDNKKAASGALHFCDETADTLNNNCQDFPSGWTFIADDVAVPGGEDVGDRFRIYVMEWTPTGVTMTVDGLEYYSQTFTSVQEEFQGDFFLLLNVAVGGNPVTDPTASTTWPMHMDIDYIRVSQ